MKDNSTNIFLRLGQQYFGWLKNDITNKIHIALSTLFFIVSIYELGFSKLHHTDTVLHLIYKIYLFSYFALYYLKNFKSNFIKNRLFWLIKSAFMVWLIFFLSQSIAPISAFKVGYSFYEYINSFYITYLLLGIIFLAEISKKINKLYLIKLNFALIIIFSFGIIIFIGALALLMPNATVGGISIIDALFTSTSAVCVTGLSVVDTATYFSPLGKAIVLLLIQIGGLGIMTFTTVFVYFFKTGNSLREQIILKDAFSADNPSDVFRIAFKILIVTIAIEAVGAFLIFMNISNSPIVGFGNKLEFSVFHSISAFCNAGFSTQTNGLNESFLRFNYGIFWIISFLIIVGGIGFPLIISTLNFFKALIKGYISKYLMGTVLHKYPKIININSRIALIMTGILLLLGTLSFFVLEYHNTLQPHTTFYGKLAVSFFNSVTPRTAGFNNVDMTSIGRPMILIMIFLMWVGASPASTGGGIKTTTFAVAFLNIFSVSRGLGRIEIYNRKIRNNSERRTLAVIILSLLTIGFGTFLIVLVQPNLSILAIAFECFSAYGTVGLSLGITGGLDEFSKSVLIGLMFLGRVGTLNFMIGILKNVQVERYQFPKENILIN